MLSAQSARYNKSPWAGNGGDSLQEIVYKELSFGQTFFTILLLFFI